MRELRSGDRYTRAMLDSLVNQILIQAGRMLGGSVLGADTGCMSLQPLSAAQRAEGRMKPVNKKELVYQAVQYMDLHVGHIEELGQVADRLGYSYSHLSHAFRLEMGMPMQSYWVSRRMMAAMNKLQAGRDSITQISEELRYQSIHAFSKAFKKMTGFTPSEYQSLYGAGWNDE
ncbi:AraC family transcriptional regulator [Paenibacillus sp. 1011MAR3C5]|nr:AraC family transcriptional regulator [Paenibacillus sp. 1011MAR3C5]